MKREEARQLGASTNPINQAISPRNVQMELKQQGGSVTSVEY